MHTNVYAVYAHGCSLSVTCLWLIQSRHQRIMPIFLPNMLFGIATVFALLCPKLCPIMPTNKCIIVITLTSYMNLRSCLDVIIL